MALEATTEQRNVHDALSGAALAKRSCQSCKFRKRKCTRELPECRLCIRGRRPCSYLSKKQAESQLVRSSDSNLRNAQSSHVSGNDFPAISFLDPALFDFCAPLANSHRRVPISPAVEDALGDIHARKTLAEEYFKTANRWMPIISRIRFFASLLNSSQASDPGVIAILLSMKLALSWRDNADPCSELYTLAKHFHLHMEHAGCLTLHAIQAAVLIVLYEVGHAIFPAAFTGIATCARNAVCLGINDMLPAGSKMWIEQEEQNRTWWAILILDRSINIGFLGRRLCTPDPGVHSVLPIDEDAWDQGKLQNDHSQTLVSTPTLQNGRYARLAQAISLLSQVFQHISSHEEAVRLDLGGIAQLERTLFALEQLAVLEEQERKICCLSSISICYSAILLLRTAYLSEQPKNLTDEGKEQSHRSIREIIARTSAHFQRYRDGWGALERFPPLALDWLYRIAVAHLMLPHGAQDIEWNEQLDQLEEALKKVRQRWRATSFHLRLLDIRKAALVPLEY